MAPRMDFPVCEEPGVEIKVLVLNYDPVMPDSDGRVLHEVCSFNDPKSLADQYIAEVELVSGGYIKYKVAEWRELNEFPVKKDGFKYSAETFLAVKANEAKPHDPDALDYDRVLSIQEVAKAIDDKTFDEVWLFGGPHFGYFESIIAGPKAYQINGNSLPEFKSKHAFAIMGFNYEHGVGEMLHHLARRTESTLARIYNTKLGEISTQWGKFSASEKLNKGFAGVGGSEWPPNAESAHDYSNSRVVWSNADIWFTYPKMKGKIKPINHENWGGPDYQRNYLKWWFARLPKAIKAGKDGRQNNWWKYVFDFNRYDQDGKTIR